MANFVNNTDNDSQLNIKRISAGVYLVGARKINAKILNEKLVVRIGGGFTSLEEFIQTNTENEQLKQQQLQRKHTEDFNNSDAGNGYEPRTERSSSMLVNTPKYSHQKTASLVNFPVGQFQIDLNLEDKVQRNNGFLRNSKTSYLTNVLSPTKSTGSGAGSEGRRENRRKYGNGNGVRHSMGTPLNDMQAILENQYEGEADAFNKGGN